VSKVHAQASADQMKIAAAAEAEVPNPYLSFVET